MRAHKPEQYDPSTRVIIHCMLKACVNLNLLSRKELDCVFKTGRLNLSRRELWNIRWNIR